MIVFVWNQGLVELLHLILYLFRVFQRVKVELSQSSKMHSCLGGQKIKEATVIQNVKGEVVKMLQVVSLAWWSAGRDKIENIIAPCLIVSEVSFQSDLNRRRGEQVVSALVRLPDFHHYNIWLDSLFVKDLILWLYSWRLKLFFRFCSPMMREQAVEHSSRRGHLGESRLWLHGQRVGEERLAAAPQQDRE